MPAVLGGGGELAGDGVGVEPDRGVGLRAPDLEHQSPAQSDHGDDGVTGGQRPGGGSAGRDAEQGVIVRQGEHDDAREQDGGQRGRDQPPPGALAVRVTAEERDHRD